MASSSSSSSITLQPKYDVFLSFRGEDTRDNFTSHLYAALCRKQIQTFIDDDGLKRGDEISPALLKAIEESKISVIIFSKDYASSRWCLDELLQILECKERNGQMVIPVFYHVDPSDVRKQTGSFEDAFVKHEKRFKEMTNKVQKWRTALTEASNLSGWDSMVIRPESKLVEKVVDDILKKLNDMSISSISIGLIGLTSRIEKIKSLLCIGLLEFHIVGIWGMGGIGKTILAGAIYNQVSSQFEGHCFSINIREESERYGLVHVRDQILSQVLGENLKIGTPTIPKFVQERIKRKKVLIVLDDVNTVSQLELLVGGQDQFSVGSRIIITTRDKQVLKGYGVDKIYEVEGFNCDEAFHLFCFYAYSPNHPYEDFVRLSNSVLFYAKGNPLALKVLASSLYGKSKEDWESAASNLKLIGDTEIHDVLKITYQRLNREEQNIFLDIACFFKGEDRYHVTSILDGCYNFSTHACLSALIDKSLISESDKHTLQMHDLLQEMGQEIVYQESEKKPNKSSRLWYHGDIYCILRDNKGTDSIKGIFLNMSKIEDLPLNSQAFVRLTSLRLLKFYDHELCQSIVDISKVHLPKGLKYLPHELRFLHWDGYPLKNLPSKFSLESIVELTLPYSKLKQLWKGTKFPFKLKFIDLHDSKCLTGIPDLSNAKVLEVINLQNCRKLVDVHPSIQRLSKLRKLDMRGCGSFTHFSRNMDFLSPITLDLSYCIELKKFPQISGNVKRLNLSGTAIEEVPPSIACLTDLVELDMQKCTRLKCVPIEICKLKSLQRMDFSDCAKLESFPEIFEQMECLESLQLNGATIKELPSSIENLNGLVNLGLRDCKNLETIPTSICSLTSLRNIDVSGCSKLEEFPENLGNLIHLDELDASRTAISHIPSSMVTYWKQISQLKLAFCNLTEIPAELCCLSSLKVLNLSGNSFASLPTNIKQLSQLKELYLNNCNMLQSFPELPLYLKDLEAMDCKQLRSLPMFPSSLEELDESEMKRSNSFTLLNYNFTFTNSLKLDENEYNKILADAQRIFQDMATASLTYRWDEVHNQAPPFSLCLPGSKLPDWISYQSSEHSVDIELSQYWFNKRFMGFVLGVVLQFEESYYGGSLHLMCISMFVTTSGQMFNPGHMLTVAKSEVLIDSDHVLLGYFPNFCAGIIAGHLKRVIFLFIPVSPNGAGQQVNCKVKCCGASPLYVRSSISIEEPQLATTNQDFGETVDRADTNGSERGTSDKEEVEVQQSNAPVLDNEVPSFYHNLHARGGLFLSYSGTFIVYFFCGLGVLWLLKLLGVFLSKQ